MDYLLANNCLSSANKMTYEKCLILRGTWLSCSKRPYITVYVILVFFMHRVTLTSIRNDLAIIDIIDFQDGGVMQYSI